MTITAWYMDDSDADQREPHKKSPNEPVSKPALVDLGIIFWEGITGEDDPRLDEIKKERGYTYTDVCNVCPDKLPGYDTKIKSFFEEHIHKDEEIRYCMEGSGYFDIRDGEDKWIRIHLQPGDMIVLPEGSYHRFTCDSDDYIKAMRLFVGEPVWTPYNRVDITEEEESRKKYVDTFINKTKKAKTEGIVGTEGNNETKVEA